MCQLRLSFDILTVDQAPTVSHCWWGHHIFVCFCKEHADWALWLAAIVGNDSDLILMALLTDAPNLHVFGQILNQEPPPVDRMKVMSVEMLHKVWRNIGAPAEKDPEVGLSTHACDSSAPALFHLPSPVFLM